MSTKSNSDTEEEPTPTTTNHTNTTNHTTTTTTNNNNNNNNHNNKLPLPTDSPLPSARGNRLPSTPLDQMDIFASPLRPLSTPTSSWLSTDLLEKSKLLKTPKFEDDLLFTPERPLRTNNQNSNGNNNNGGFDLIDLSPLPDSKNRSILNDNNHSKSLLSPLRSPMGLKTPQRVLSSPSLPLPSPLSTNPTPPLPPQLLAGEFEKEHSQLHDNKTHSWELPHSLPFAFHRAHTPPLPPHNNNNDEDENDDNQQQQISSSSSASKGAALPPPLPPSHQRVQLMEGNDGYNEIQPYDDPASKKCNCKNSKCLKLYCVCFSNKRLCNDCNCQGCMNKQEHMEAVIQARKAKITTDPNTFNPKIIAHSHQRGCHCRKGCQKKYCECFSAGIPCGVACKCLNCLNCVGHVTVASGAGAAFSQESPAFGIPFADGTPVLPSSDSSFSLHNHNHNHNGLSVHGENTNSSVNSNDSANFFPPQEISHGSNKANFVHSNEDRFLPPELPHDLETMQMAPTTTTTTTTSAQTNTVLTGSGFSSQGSVSRDSAPSPAVSDHDGNSVASGDLLDASPNSRGKKRRQSLISIMRPRKRMSTKKLSSPRVVRPTTTRAPVESVQESPVSPSQQNWQNTNGHHSVVVGGDDSQFPPNDNRQAVSQHRKRQRSSGSIAQPNFNDALLDDEDDRIRGNFFGSHSKATVKHEFCVGFPATTRSTVTDSSVEFARGNGRMVVGGVPVVGMNDLNAQNNPVCVLTSPVEKDSVVKLHKRRLEPSSIHVTQQYGGKITLASVSQVRDKPATPTWRTAIGVKRVQTIST